MPREKVTNLWKDTLNKAALARETALLQSSGSRAAKLKQSQALAQARRQPKKAGATLQPTALSAMLGALDELSAPSQAAAKPAPRRVPAPLRAALEVHAAYTSGDPLASLRKHIGTL